MLNKSTIMDLNWRQITVVIRVFTSLLLSNGSILAMGIYTTPILEEFNVGSAVAGWICSLSVAILCITGPVASVVVNKFPYRWVLMAGAAIQAFGMMMTYFADSTTTLFISLGIITGFGGALVYICQPVILASYFTKCSGIIIGISWAGSACGIFVLPLLINLLMSNYGWRIAVLIEGALIFQVVAIGATFQPKPKEPSSIHRKKKVDTTDDCETLKQLYENEREPSHSSTSWMPSHFVLLTDKPIIVLVYITAFFMNMALTVALVHSSNQIIINGLSDDKAVFVLSLIGIGSIMGRLVQGVIVDILKVSPVTIYEITLILSAAATFINPIINTYVGFMVSALGIGFTSGILYGVINVMWFHLVGASHVATAIGMELFADCMGVMTGGYLAGAIRDMTGTYRIGYYVFGATYIIGACVFLPVYFADIRKRSWISVQNADGKTEDEKDPLECDRTQV